MDEREKFEDYCLVYRLIEKGTINFARYGTSLPSDALILFFLATNIFVHMFVWSDRLAGGSKLRNLNRMLKDLTCPWTVADWEL